MFSGFNSTTERNIINDRGPVRSFMIMFLPFNAAVSTMALEAPVDSASGQ